VRAGANAASQFPELPFLKLSAPGAIAPERATSFDLGVEQRPGRTLRWGITGFMRDESSILRRTGEERVVDGEHVLPSTFPEFSSSLDGTARGVDMIFERRAAQGPSGWLGYTFAHTRYHDMVTGEDFDGDCDQRHTLNGFVRQRLSYRWTASAKMRLGSNFPIVGYFAGTPRSLTLAETRNQVRLPMYFRLDVQANRTFTFKSRRLTLFVEVMNVTNRRNLAQADGTVSDNLVASRFADQVIPRLPSVGMLIEF
jgi:outer membrane receptor protein involved in Fe transport